MCKHNKLKRILTNFVIPFPVIFPLSSSLPPSIFGGPLRQRIPLVRHSHASINKTFDWLELSIFLLPNYMLNPNRPECCHSGSDTICNEPDNPQGKLREEGANFCFICFLSLFLKRYYFKSKQVKYVSLWKGITTNHMFI